jgi:hypothetical protein
VWLVRWIAVAVAVVVALSAIGAGVLWLNAGRALDAAVAVAAEDRSHACTGKDALPSGYPRAPIEIQSDDGAEQAVWRLACKRLGEGACPRTLAAEARYVGFRLYLPLRLDACRVKAISLRPEAPLGAALRRVYPNGAPAVISREAALCVRRTATRGATAPLPAICDGI